MYVPLLAAVMDAPLHPTFFPALVDAAVVVAAAVVAVEAAAFAAEVVAWGLHGVAEAEAAASFVVHNHLVAVVADFDVPVLPSGAVVRLLWELVTEEPPALDAPPWLDALPTAWHPVLAVAAVDEVPAAVPAAPAAWADAVKMAVAPFGMAGSIQSAVMALILAYFLFLRPLPVVIAEQLVLRAASSIAGA